jgi:putative nucleotidyltransferase with HDIG domain
MNSPLRILLLEDNPADAALILATLENDGIRCDALRVETQADFLGALEWGRFDLILSDCSLPSFDGLSALKFSREINAIRAGSEAKSIETPFIFVSGTIGEELAIDTLKSGATDYVLKQRLSRLAPAVHRAIAEAEERAERRKAQDELAQRAQELASANKELLETMAALERSLEREKSYLEQMNAVHLRTIEALALAIGAKDHTTREHLERVQLYAAEIGKDLKLPEQEFEALRAAAVLHDIGKLAVPEYIISKPGQLTRAEFEKMKVHPVVGAEILEQVGFPYPVVPIVLAHHEKWNGTGYPRGLKGEEIPIGARILAAVDCFDALASDRQYRTAFPLDEAMAKVVSESGSSFDPAVVRTLQARYVELEQRVRSIKPQLKPLLSKDIEIACCSAPAAGFEDEEAPDADQLVHLHAALEQAESVNDRHARDLLGDGSRRLQEMLSVVALRLKDVVPFDAIAFYAWTDGALRASFASGDDHRRLRSLRVPAGKGLIGWVAEVGKPVINGNPAVEPGFRSDQGSPPLLKLALAVPIPDGGEKPGVVAIYRTSQDRFTASDLANLLPYYHELGRLLAGHLLTLVKLQIPLTEASSTLL